MVFVEKLRRTLFLATLYFSVACFAALVATILLQVVSRYIFASPPGWTEEAGRYLMIWCGLTGAAAAYADRADPVLVNLNFTPGGWPSKLSAVLELAAVATLSAPLCFYGPSLVQYLMRIPSDTIGAPMGLIVSVVPIAAGLILLQSLLRVVMVWAAKPMED